MDIMKVKGIKFGFLSPKMIKEMSAVRIEHAELYDPDGYPIDSGLTDLRLGVVDPGLRCRTCGGTIGQCTGHFGHLELTKPVIHPLFGKHVYMILKATCRECSRPLMSNEELKVTSNSLKEIYKRKPSVCPHCNEKQKIVEFQKPTTFREGKVEINPEEVRQRLEKISDDDLKLLKINGGRPEWFVFTILPIPPVTVRPSITLETGERSEDDITHKLVDVVRINERFRKNLELGAPDFIIADIWELLQYHISTLVDNEISTLPPARHRSGRALKTFVQRLGKKEGRFRGHLSGKRVNFSARTVISPDPMISINEVGVPDEIAVELTVPIKVNSGNKEDLKKYILNGSVYPGANYIIRPDNIRKKITEENKKDISEEIENGYTVERHLIDGDISIFNRQPSLHRMSMMCHRVRIMPYKTFRLNLAVTIPYNADFDGDEMNLHIPQKIEAQIEADMLMRVEKNIRSPRYGLPIIACKQDHITGCYLLTKKDTKLSKKEVMELLFAIGRYDLISEIKETTTGRELFSLFLPKDLNITFRTSTFEPDEEDGMVVIKDGQIKSGVIDDRALGERKGKLIDKIHMEYGDNAIREFLDNITKLSLEVITRNGFSISLSEQDISENAEKKIEELLEECDAETNKLIKSQKGDKKELESKIQQISGTAANSAGKIIKKELPFNNAVIMAKTGARGSYVNLIQMCAFVGQEALEGERINRGYIGRTLPHFKIDDLGLKAHGFVFHGYKKGLDPFEFFFDAINSRENLMDKSLHTRHSGYMERRLIHALQDLYVKHDGTVRDSVDRIVQFKAGEDGIDPAKSSGGKIIID
ncbi:MAG: DNA-directed RNA polymerase subunit A' [Candidatus Aenigmarchaeota archaeon]|nr:DNA-directed RNA polymerase subunit A' [Candidatus Aenigmarchaeota archaeon]